MLNNRFISFEGSEGVGKTTLVDKVAAYFEQHQTPYVRTREPGGTSFASQLRSILIDPNTDINSDSELLLLFAGRVDHINKLIIPSLNSGKWVLCDRFVDSSFAYQGYGRNNGDLAVLEKIKQLKEIFVEIEPSKTFLLDMPTEFSMQRMCERGEKDRIELENFEFFERVREGYWELAMQFPSRYIMIDATGTPDEVFEQVEEHLNLTED